MERVRVNSLVPGTKLTQPLYDSDRRLLVGPGNRLTAETFRSLARSSTEYVYLGEWDQADFEGFQKRSISLEDYRRQADEAAAVLEAEIERELDRIELDVKPGLRALENRVDNSLLVARPSERIRQWHALHDRGVNVVEQIFEGQIDADEIGDVAGAMVDEVIAAFVKDRSLLANLTNLRKLSGYLYAHSMNVTVLSVQIASALKYDAVQVKSVGIAALLQDFGMAMAPEELVNLPRTLTREEKLGLQKHSIHGLCHYADAWASLHCALHCLPVSRKRGPQRLSESEAKILDPPIRADRRRGRRIRCARLRTSVAKSLQPIPCNGICRQRSCGRKIRPGNRSSLVELRVALSYWLDGADLERRDRPGSSCERR